MAYCPLIQRAPAQSLSLELSNFLLLSLQQAQASDSDDWTGRQPKLAMRHVPQQTAHSSIWHECLVSNGISHVTIMDNLVRSQTALSHTCSSSVGAEYATLRIAG